MSKRRVQTAELARFIPAGILTRLARNPQPLTAPQREQFPAAALFADISGFTRLSEQLAAQGPAGVETLTATLNAYFGQLIEIIAEHGGDVVKFAGDAMLAIWREEDVSALDRAAGAAARCAQEAQRSLREFTAPDGGTLRLRLGIGAGEATMFTLGGVFGRWESVVCGPPVMEATLAATAGLPGEVIAGPAAWEKIARRAEGETILADGGGRRRLVAAPDGSERAPLPPLPEVPAKYVPLLRSYIPAAAWRKLEAGQSAWLAELRRLTVLFVNLPDLGADTSVERAQTVMQALQNGLYRYEGSVNKLSLDEKGITLVAALGLPPLAHEDDPARGVRAAQEIMARLGQLDCRGAVGVTSGRVFCGTVGSERRCEYTIIGDTVNLSARLMQTAKERGGILCDAPTHDALRGRIKFETLPPVTLKGKEQPVPIFRPLREAQEPMGATDQPPMVGRVAELARAKEWLAALASERTGRAVIVEGEAGIGKSRFVAAVLEAAHTAGVTALVGAADSIERNTPYFAWRGVFRRLLHVAEQDADDQEAPALSSINADPELVSLAPLLSVVLAKPIPDNDVTVHMSQEARVISTNKLLVSLLEQHALAEPLLILLEDCHWMDSASWLLARAVAQRRDLLLALVTRPTGEETPADFAQIRAEPSTLELPLSPLSTEEILALVCQRLEVRALPESVAELIGPRAQGHPSYAEELAYTLRDQGWIEIADGECRLSSGKNIADLQVPDTLQGVVISRIDLLSPPAQMALKVASVIGRVFSCRLLREVFPISGETQNHGLLLDILLRLDLTSVESAQPEPKHMFRQIITQEVAYQLMPAGQRSQLHRAIAEWYEARHRTDLPAYYPLLARHWSQTDQIDKTIYYCEKAGEDALRQYANQEAVRFFRQALELDAKSKRSVGRFRRARWLRQLAQAHYNLSDFAPSLEAFREATALLGCPMPPSAARAVWRSATLFVRSSLRQMLPWMQRRIAPAKRERLLEGARAYERIAQIAYLDNDRMQAVHAVFKALHLAGQVGPSGELARAQAASIIVSGLMMLHGVARAQAERARATALLAGEPPAIANVEYLRGMYWVTVGRWDEAVRDLTAAINMFEISGERRRWFEAMFTLAKVYGRRGDLPASERCAVQLADAGRRNEVPAVEIWGLEWQTWVMHVMGARREEEVAVRARMIDCLERNLADIPKADQLLGCGVAALSFWREAGREAEALAFAARAMTIIESTAQVAHYILPAMTGIAQISFERWERARGDRQARRAHAKQLARIVRALSEFRLMYPIGLPAYALHRGQWHWARGRRGWARRAWRKGIDAAQRIGLPYEEGLLHLQLGECTEETDARQRHLEAARALCLRIGARREQARAERLLRG